MEIQVGEYIRTENGIIGKVFDEDSVGENGVCIDTTYLDEWGDETDFVKYEDIKKHSFNIVDLIEEGDYVNGKKVLDNVSNAFLEVSSSNLGNNRIFARMIKSIVTKELFKLEEYIL